MFTIFFGLLFLLTSQVFLLDPVCLFLTLKCIFYKRISQAVSLQWFMCAEMLIPSALEVTKLGLGQPEPSRQSPLFSTIKAASSAYFSVP